LKRLKAISPPVAVQSEHADLIKGAGELNRELKPILAKLHQGYYVVVAQLPSLRGSTQIAAALGRLKARGYLDWNSGEGNEAQSSTGRAASDRADGCPHVDGDPQAPAVARIISSNSYDLGSESEFVRFAHSTKGAGFLCTANV
jgi:hypothetical protein